MTLGKYEKETILLTSEGDATYDIETFDVNLQKRLTDYSKKYPELCKLQRKNTDGSACFVIDKSRVSIRLIPPYTEQRRKAASDLAKKNNSAANFKKD